VTDYHQLSKQLLIEIAVGRLEGQWLKGPEAIKGQLSDFSGA
jgi:hypothetical protein